MSVSMHKVNRIMRFRGGERKGEGWGKEGREEEKGRERGGKRKGEWEGKGRKGVGKPVSIVINKGRLKRAIVSNRIYKWHYI